MVYLASGPILTSGSRAGWNTPGGLLRLKLDRGGRSSVGTGQEDVVGRVSA